MGQEDYKMTALMGYVLPTEKARSLLKEFDENVMNVIEHLDKQILETLSCFTDEKGNTGITFEEARQIHTEAQWVPKEVRKMKEKVWRKAFVKNGINPDKCKHFQNLKNYHWDLRLVNQAKASQPSTT